MAPPRHVLRPAHVHQRSHAIFETQRQGPSHRDHALQLQNEQLGSSSGHAAGPRLLRQLPVEEAHHPFLGLSERAGQAEELRSREMLEPCVHERRVPLRGGRRVWVAPRLGYVNGRTARFISGASQANNCIRLERRGYRAGCRERGQPDHGVESERCHGDCAVRRRSATASPHI